MVKKRQPEALENGTSTDSGEEDMNGPFVAASNCLHIKKSVDTGRVRRHLKTTGLLYDCVQCQKLESTDSTSAEVAEFEYDNTLWLCLKCGTQLCGRSKNQHALQHYRTPHSDSHALTMNTRSFEIWCYDCDNEVSAQSRKNLLECVEMVKRLAQKPPTVVTQPSPADATVAATTAAMHNVTHNITTTLQQICPVMTMTGVSFDDSGNGRRVPAASKSSIPLPPPPPPLLTNGNGALSTVPGKAKRLGKWAGAANNTNSVGFGQAPSMTDLERLPRVRGLTNLGNTCFFNAVMQCLAQTPFLLDVLKELSEPGEQFVLPGGKFTFKDKGDIELPMIKGSLSSWGSLTSTLANALEELQTGGGVFTPRKLFDKLCSKCAQFTGGDQHDAHELLRQLLESVRSEDLKRYQRVILQSLGYKDQDISSVSEEMRQKCKIYGNQAADRILHPEQIFRGFLVSTLTCQECFNVSSRHESFLDMSLPVAVEKPQPPQRRKNSPDNSPPAINTKFTTSDCNVAFTPASFFLHGDEQEALGPSKSQVKREKERERKAKRAAKHQRHKQAQKAALVTNGLTDEAAATTSCENLGAGDAADSADAPTASDETRATSWGEGPREDSLSSSGSTSEHSDADVEDNLVEDNATIGPKPAPKFYTDNNGNTQQLGEKRDDTPEHMDKDSLEEDENDSGIATSPAPNTCSSSTNNNNAAARDSKGVAAAAIVSAGLSEQGATFLRQISLGSELPVCELACPTAAQLLNGEAVSEVAAQFDQLQLREQAQKKTRTRVRTQSYSDWSTTIAPRYQCEDGECSVQSCLNNFTAVELMTGQNKVGCESCTRRINGSDEQAKSVNTNATKQLLVSSPPAVLILHLKRFQLGPRCIFRKLTRSVTYPMLLDIAAFCGSKVKNLPNIDRKQKKLLYALYGVVEHSGGMYGGHYTAYVKVRPKVTPDDKRWKFLPHGSKAELDQDDDQLKKLEELLVKEKAREMRMNAMDDSDDFSSSSSNSSISVDATPNDDTASNEPSNATGGAANAAYTADEEAANVEIPPGKWYYVSDSRVQEVNEETALKAQAYMLFYERIY